MVPLGVEIVAFATKELIPPLPGVSAPRVRVIVRFTWVIATEVPPTVALTVGVSRVNVQDVTAAEVETSVESTPDELVGADAEIVVDSPIQRAADVSSDIPVEVGPASDAARKESDSSGAPPQNGLDNPGDLAVPSESVRYRPLTTTSTVADEVAPEATNQRAFRMSSL